MTAAILLIYLVLVAVFGYYGAALYGYIEDRKGVLVAFLAILLYCIVIGFSSVFLIVGLGKLFTN